MNGEKLVRKTSMAGPCLVQGLLVRETAKFYVYREWQGGNRYEGERRIAKAYGVHVEACRCCRDHVETNYPNGYMD